MGVEKTISEAVIYNRRLNDCWPAGGLQEIPEIA